MKRASVVVLCCGLLGLKPARGRVSHAPDLGDQFLRTDRVIARTTRSLASWQGCPALHSSAVATKESTSGSERWSIAR